MLKVMAVKFLLGEKGFTNIEKEKTKMNCGVGLELEANIYSCFQYIRYRNKHMYKCVYVYVCIIIHIIPTLSIKKI